MASGHDWRLPPDETSGSGTLWFLPSQNVLYPLSCSTWPIVAAWGGMRPLDPGNPFDASVIAELLFRW